jgi:hypothetical protein
MIERGLLRGQLRASTPLYIYTDIRLPIEHRSCRYNLAIQGAIFTSNLVEKEMVVPKVTRSKTTIHQQSLSTPRSIQHIQSNHKSHLVLALTQTETLGGKFRPLGEARLVQN